SSGLAARFPVLLRCTFSPEALKSWRPCLHPKAFPPDRNAARNPWRTSSTVSPSHRNIAVCPVSGPYRDCLWQRPAGWDSDCGRGCVTMRHVHRLVSCLSVAFDKGCAATHEFSHARVDLWPLRANKLPELILKVLALIISR